MHSQKLSEEQLRDIVQGSSEAEWRYEMRRECQEIPPGLLLGPAQVSKSFDALRLLGVTHIVCIRDSKEAFSVRPRFPESFKYLVLDVQDSEEQNVIRLFPQAKEFIDNALKSNGRVLIHCNGGISLSPVFVVMYVMQYFQMNFEDALRTVQNRRYCISPNGGFLTQIKEFESIYKAGIQVAANSTRTDSTARRKRYHEEGEESDDGRVDDRKRAVPVNGSLNALSSPTTPSHIDPGPDAMEI